MDIPENVDAATVAHFSMWILREQQAQIKELQRQVAALEAESKKPKLSLKQLKEPKP